MNRRYWRGGVDGVATTWETGGVSVTKCRSSAMTCGQDLWRIMFLLFDTCHCFTFVSSWIDLLAADSSSNKEKPTCVCLWSFIARLCYNRLVSPFAKWPTRRQTNTNRCSFVCVMLWLYSANCLLSVFAKAWKTNDESKDCFGIAVLTPLLLCVQIWQVIDWGLWYWWAKVIRKTSVVWQGIKNYSLMCLCLYSSWFDFAEWLLLPFDKFLFANAMYRSISKSVATETSFKTIYTQSH